MAREIVDFKMTTSVMQSGSTYKEVIRVIAKCDDHTLWLWEDSTWKVLPNIPQGPILENTND